MHEPWQPTVWSGRDHVDIAAAGRVCQPFGQGEYPVSRFQQILFASIGVFIGSLLSDILFGDRIQAEDINQAAMIALIAALIQAWLTRKRPEQD